MWKLNTTFQTVTIVLVTVLIGLTIVKIVEARLSDVSINMPKITINLPEQGHMLGGGPAPYPKTAETVIPGEAGQCLRMNGPVSEHALIPRHARCMTQPCDASILHRAVG